MRSRTTGNAETRSESTDPTGSNMGSGNRIGIDEWDPYGKVQALAMTELGARYGKSSMGLPEDSSRHHIVGKNIGYQGRTTSCIAGPYTVRNMEFHHSWGPSKHFPLSSPYRQNREACTARGSYCQKHIHRKTANKRLE